MGENNFQKQQNKGFGEPRETLQGFYEFGRNLRKGFVEFLIFIAILIGLSIVIYIGYYIHINPWEIIFVKIVWGLFISASIYFSIVFIFSFLQLGVNRISRFINNILNPDDSPIPIEKEIKPKKPVEMPILTPVLEKTEESRGDITEKKEINWENEMLIYATMSELERKEIVNEILTNEDLIDEHGKEKVSEIANYVQSESFSGNPKIGEYESVIKRRRKEAEENYRESQKVTYEFDKKENRIVAKKKKK